MDITPRRNKKRRLRDWSSARDRRGKERRVSPSVYGDGDTCDSTAPEESSGSEDEVKQLVKVQESSRTLHHVRPTELTYPRSTYDNYDPPLPRSREAFALRELLVSTLCFDYLFAVDGNDFDRKNGTASLNIPEKTNPTGSSWTWISLWSIDRRRPANHCVTKLDQENQPEQPKWNPCIS